MKLTDAERARVLYIKTHFDAAPRCSGTLFEGMLHGYVKDWLPIIDRLSQEPEVVRAVWTDDMYFDEPVTRCTACGRGFAKGHKAERFPYCPHCGAKMDGERRKEQDDG